METTVDGETLEKRLKDTVINQLSELKTISMLAVEKNIALTTSEKKRYRRLVRSSTKVLQRRR